MDGGACREDDAVQEEKIKELKKQLHEKTFELQRLESQLDKDLAGFTEFLDNVAESSARSCLGGTVTLGSLEILGRGRYGYVLCGRRATSGMKVVVKLQSPRWVAVAAREWSHGSAVAQHDFIVDHITALMHHDHGCKLHNVLASGFESGVLHGTRPKFFPQTYFCLIMEYMDRGTLQSLMSAGQIAVEGIAAVTRCIASALSYIHSVKRTHNDIKPESVLLKHAPSGKHLIPKLADLGLAECSVDRTRDCDMLAYLIWCMGLNREFRQVPRTAKGRDLAVKEFKANDRAGRYATWMVLHDILNELWKGDTSMLRVERHRELQGHLLVEPENKEAISRLQQSARASAIGDFTSGGMQDVEKMKLSDRSRQSLLEDGADCGPLLSDPRSVRDSEPEPESSARCDDEELEQTMEALTDALAKKSKEVTRLWTHHDMELEGRAEFCRQLAESSAEATLSQEVDQNTSELLGRGHYGYVFKCKKNGSNELVVVKLQNPRWVHVCIREWMHGSSLGQHQHIVDYSGVYLHRDKSYEIQGFINNAFDDGTLQGKRPKKLPESYYCLVMEYMDRGTVHGMLQAGLLQLQGVAAVTRSVASALGYMHQKKVTHNDIKPENILLKHSSKGDELIAKLADLGLAEHSTERKRDFELFGFTVWCMGMGQDTWGKVPSQSEMDDHVSDFRSRAKGGARRSILKTEDTEKLKGVLADVISGLWREDLTMKEIERLPEFQGLHVREPKKQEDVETLKRGAEIDVARRSSLKGSAYAVQAVHRLSELERTKEMHDDNEEEEVVVSRGKAEVQKMQAWEKEAAKSCMRDSFARVLAKDRVTNSQQKMNGDIIPDTQICTSRDLVPSPSREVQDDAVHVGIICPGNGERQSSSSTHERAPSNTSRFDIVSEQALTEIEDPLMSSADGDTLCLSPSSHSSSRDDRELAKQTAASTRESEPCDHEDGFREHVGSDGVIIYCCDACGMKWQDAQIAAGPSPCIHPDGLREEFGAYGEILLCCDLCGFRRAARCDENEDLCDHPDGVTEVVGTDGKTYICCDICGMRSRKGETLRGSIAAADIVTMERRQSSRKRTNNGTELTNVTSRSSIGLPNVCEHEDGFREEYDSIGQKFLCCDKCGLRRCADEESGSKLIPSTCKHVDGFREELDSLGKMVLRCDHCGLCLRPDEEPVSIREEFDASRKCDDQDRFREKLDSFGQELRADEHVGSELAPFSSKCEHDDGFREEVDSAGQTWLCCDHCGLRRRSNEESACKTASSSIACNDKDGFDEKQDSPSNEELASKPASSSTTCNHDDGFREEFDTLGRLFHCCDTCGMRFLVHEGVGSATKCEHEDGFRDEVGVDGLIVHCCDTCGFRWRDVEHSLDSCLHPDGFREEFGPSGDLILCCDLCGLRRVAQSDEDGGICDHPDGVNEVVGPDGITYVCCDICGMRNRKRQNIRESLIVADMQAQERRRSSAPRKGAGPATRSSIISPTVCEHEDGFREEFDSSGQKFLCCDKCGLRQRANEESSSNLASSSCKHLDGYREEVDASGQIILFCDLCGLKRRLSAGVEKSCSPCMHPDGLREVLHSNGNLFLVCDVCGLQRRCMDEDVAAAKIQAVHRGSVARRELREEHRKKAPIEEVDHGPTISTDNVAVATIQSRNEGEVCRELIHEPLEAALDAELGSEKKPRKEDAAATTIQAVPQQKEPLVDETSIKGETSKEGELATTLRSAEGGNVVSRELAGEHQSTTSIGEDVGAAKPSAADAAAAKAQTTPPESAARREFAEEHRQTAPIYETMSSVAARECTAEQRKNVPGDEIETKASACRDVAQVNLTGAMRHNYQQETATSVLSNMPTVMPTSACQGSTMTFPSSFCLAADLQLGIGVKSLPHAQIHSPTAALSTTVQPIPPAQSRPTSSYRRSPLLSRVENSQEEQRARVSQLLAAQHHSVTSSQADAVLRDIQRVQDQAVNVASKYLDDLSGGSRTDAAYTPDILAKLGEEALSSPITEPGGDTKPPSSLDRPLDEILRPGSTGAASVSSDDFLTMVNGAARTTTTSSSNANAKSGMPVPSSFYSSPSSPQRNDDQLMAANGSTASTQNSALRNTACGAAGAGVNAAAMIRSLNPDQLASMIKNVSPTPPWISPTTESGPARLHTFTSPALTANAGGRAAGDVAIPMQGFTPIAPSSQVWRSSDLAPEKLQQENERLRSQCAMLRTELLRRKEAALPSTCAPASSPSTDHAVNVASTAVTAVASQPPSSNGYCH